MAQDQQLDLWAQLPLEAVPEICLANEARLRRAGVTTLGEALALDHHQAVIEIGVSFAGWGVLSSLKVGGPT
jgi:hypothetical protein